MNYIHGEDRNQMRIESLESFASPDSEVRVIDKIVDAMDIESLGFKLGNNKDSGRPKFDPKYLLKLYIYGYFNGIRSSRKLAKQCVINKEVIWLIKDIKPKYRVIADFRKDNIDDIDINDDFELEDIDDFDPFDVLDDSYEDKKVVW